MGGDALFGYDGVFYTLFLLTPPRGGDVPVSHVARYHCHFYLRPRVGGDLPISPIWALRCQFLLTPPRGGRRKEWVDMVEYIHISTHAPAWGGDIVSMGAPSEERISTHAPAWGATRSSTPSWWSYGNFYSRPRMGGDTIL